MKKHDIIFWQKGFKGIAHGGFHISPEYLSQFIGRCQAQGIHVVGIRSRTGTVLLECILQENEAYRACFGTNKEESWYLLT